MLVECPKCGEFIREQPPFGGFNHHFDTQIIEETCNQCIRGYSMAEGVDDGREDTTNQHP